MSSSFLSISLIRVHPFCIAYVRIFDGHTTGSVFLLNFIKNENNNGNMNITTECSSKGSHTYRGITLVLFYFHFAFFISHLIVIAPARVGSINAMRCDAFHPNSNVQHLCTFIYHQIDTIIVFHMFFFSLSLFLSVCLISPIHSDGWGWARGKDEFWNKTKKNLNCALWRMKFMPQFHFKQRWSYKMKWNESSWRFLVLHAIARSF